MGGINAYDGAEATVALKIAMIYLDKMTVCVRKGYTAVNAHPENTAVAMILTPEFENIAQRKEKLESALIAAQKILQEALK